MSYLNKTAHQLLVDRVNEVNGGVFSADDLTFGPPMVTTEFERNTKFQVIPGARFTPEEVDYFIWVNRLDATELFSRFGVNVLEVPNVGNTVETARWIAQTYGLPITDSDIVVDDVGADEFDLTFTATSPILMGSLRCVRTPDPLYLSDLLIVNVLQGFDYPDAIVDHLVPPVVEPDAVVGTHGTKPNGTLINGSGLPARGFTVATNNELELAISASIWKMNVAPNYIEPTADGVYNIEVARTGEWNFIFSVSTFGSQERITDLYDVILYVKSIATGERLEFRLTVDEADHYHWVNESYGLDISDSAVQGTTVQNAQRLSFYAPLFSQTPRVEDAAPGVFTGEFELGLIGHRRNAIVPRVASIIKVNASVAP